MKSILNVIIGILIGSLITFIIFQYKKISHTANHFDDMSDVNLTLSDIIKRNEKSIFVMQMLISDAEKINPALHTEKIENDKCIHSIELCNRIGNAFLKNRNLKEALDSLYQQIQSDENLKTTFNSMVTDKNASSKILRINLIKNSIMENYLFDFQKNAIPYTYAKVDNIAKKDTIKYGELYQSRLVFNVFDLTNNRLFIMENGDTLINGEFKEKGMTYGINKRKGLFHVMRNQDILFFPIEFEYYVK